VSKASFEAEVDHYRRELAARRGELLRAFKESAAVIATRKDGRLELLIRSGEMSRGGKKLRVTTFMVDGPWGHQEYEDDIEIANDLARTAYASVRPASEDEVIGWTTTPEFVRGTKLVALVQATNAIRFYASKAGVDSPTWKAATAVLRRSDEMVARDDIEGATKLVEHELEKFAPKGNPSRQLRQNPPWVTGAIARAYENLSDKIPPAWLPRLSDVRADRSTMLSKLTEYGCGAYGCVLPTLDPEVVLKITTDETEAEFAAELSADLAAAIVVEYKMVVRLSAEHEGRPIYLLWRQSAEAVGQVEAELGELAASIVDHQHQAARRVVHAVIARGAGLDEALQGWLAACAAMASQTDVPELATLAAGMLLVYREQRIFFGDVHVGNLGRVDGQWVITDPGNVLVLR
jgi:streptomycin 6-kinase